MTEHDGCDVIKYTSFDDMDLPETILRGIYAYGFDKPSTIQQLAIRPIIEKNDVIAQAQSGTGKTGTFLIAAMSIIEKRLYSPQVLIIAPTRELAIQIHMNAVALNTFSKFSIDLLIGGHDRRNQTSQSNQTNEKFKDDTQMIIGTPGKIFYMLSKHILRTSNLKLLIMDEADEMLNTCFKDQICEIFKFIPNQTRVAIFSATITQETLSITENFMINPKKILVKNDELTLEGIRQYYVNIEDEQFKYETLTDLYKYLSINHTIIYCNSKKKTQYIHQRLLDNNFASASIHSEMTQQERNEVIRKFRMGEVRILLATDIIARGLDVQQVSTVINFDLPVKKEIYIHRIGRSGRYGRKGVAINFVTRNDFNYLKQIESFYMTTIEAFPDPSGVDFSI